MKHLHTIKITALVAVLSLPFLALGANGVIDNPLGEQKSLFVFLDTIIKALLQLGAVLAVIAVIYAGFTFVTAQGDEGKIKTAKSVLLYTVIGLAILLGAEIISAVIKNTITNVQKAV